MADKKTVIKYVSIGLIVLGSIGMAVASVPEGDVVGIVAAVFALVGAIGLILK